MNVNKEDTTIPSLFMESLERVLKANDAYGLFRSLTGTQKIERLMLTKPEEKQKLESCGYVDETIKERLQLFLQAVAFAIEQKSGKIVSTMMELDEEGFGRIVLFAGRLILVNKSIRGLKKFAFTKMEDLEKEGQRYVSEALFWLNKYPEVSA